MVNKNSPIVNLVAGGVGGTAGAVLTCPLEVVKVRLQSSKGEVTQNGHGNSSGKPLPSDSATKFENNKKIPLRRFTPHLPQMQVFHTSNTSYMCSKCCYDNKPSSRQIVRKEGFRALFKGLGPNLIGIAPSKATYFYAYSSAKRMLNEMLPTSDTPLVHMCSAAYAGFIAASVVNPIWLVKTRLQLDRHSVSQSQTVTQCIANVYKKDGIKGFYKGVTASYAGISETMLQFVLYEYLRSVAISDPDRRTELDYFKYMYCGAAAKLCATVLAYPHEVVRTRMREENSKYKGFFTTLLTVAREEKFKALYRGLSVHLLRTIPNTAITMGSYELVLSLLKSALPDDEYDSHE